MMEVDSEDNSCAASVDSGKFVNLKAFVDAARDFESSHSESSVNLMNRYLGLIASACDLSIFCPGRSEVCAFFSSLWRVMSDIRGPHWSGVAVLSRACIEPSARHALTHTYKFMPILTRLLSNNISHDKKLRLLNVMQEISYGIKISWQESYLTNLMKQLTEWITQPFTDAQVQLIAHRSLTVLVNVCYTNLPAVYTLMRTVDTKNFIIHLMSLKDQTTKPIPLQRGVRQGDVISPKLFTAALEDAFKVLDWKGRGINEGGYGGVDVCRLLLCLSAATRGAGATRQADVNSYLTCAMQTFSKAVEEKDATQLLHAYTFMKDLSEDSNLRSLVTAYPKFTVGLDDALMTLQNLMELSHTPNGSIEPEQISGCVQNAFKFITVLISLEVAALRKFHCQILCLCIIGHRLCLPECLELFAAVMLLYRGEGKLPKDIIATISDGLTEILVPPSLEPGKAGLQWLQVVGALSETDSMQQRVLQHVTPDSYEDTLYNVLQYTSQNGAVGIEQAQVATLVACKTALTLAVGSPPWDAAMRRFLTHHQVRKMLCASVSSRNGTRRKDALLVVKHPCFPSEKMAEVFGDSPCPAEEARARAPAEGAGGGGGGGEGWAPRLAPAQERAVDALLRDLGAALRENRISDIATSSVMELYGYKMTCLEQRLHSHSVALQGASEHMASLQHSLALMQATNTAQQDVFYTTQMQNEKHKKTIETLHKQMDEAEAALRSFKAKVVAEKYDKEKQRELLQNEFRNQLNAIEEEMKNMERENESKLKKAAQEMISVQKLLEQETSKNTELRAELMKFDEREQQLTKEMEEAATLERSLRKELEHKDQAIKNLEKTVLERENRLYQLNNQLEEMKKIQEMVAKLINKNSSNNSSVDGV